MLKFDAVLLACAAALLSACAQQQPPPPVAGPFPYPVQKQDPIRETSQQLYSVDQVLRQIQSLQGTISRF
jgi:outer membrane biogenesis lipoprotein LolB